MLLGAPARPARAASAGEIIALADCGPGFKWLVPSAPILHPTEAVQRNENRTNTRQTATFISTAARTVQRQISAGVETEVGGRFPFVKASIKARFGIDVVRSKTTTVSNSQAAVIAPHHVAIGAYGVYVRVFSG